MRFGQVYALGIPSNVEISKSVILGIAYRLWEVTDLELGSSRTPYPCPTSPSSHRPHRVDPTNMEVSP